MCCLFHRDAFRSVFTVIFAVLAIGSAIQFVRLKKNIGFKNINSIAIVFGLIFFGCTCKVVVEFENNFTSENHLLCGRSVRTVGNAKLGSRSNRV